MTSNTDSVTDVADAYAWAWNEIHGKFRDVVTTWKTDPLLDLIYDDLRQQHYNRQHLRLYRNYSHDHVKEVSVKSIYWRDDGSPGIICSVLGRKCWPQGTYRILNRLWKPTINTGPRRGIDHGFSMLVINQTQWCMDRGARAVFMSRQTDGWTRWAGEHFNRSTGLFFECPTGRYLTCDDDENNECWQKILIHGDVNSVLNTWRNKG